MTPRSFSRRASALISTVELSTFTDKTPEVDPRPFPATSALSFTAVTLPLRILAVSTALEASLPAVTLPSRILAVSTALVPNAAALTTPVENIAELLIAPDAIA